jgi:hypothetical protein
MAELTSKQYDELERAVRDGTRVSIMRRGTEYLVIPQAIRMRGGKEAIEARNPTTGDNLIIFIDDMDSFVVLTAGGKKK